MGWGPRDMGDPAAAGAGQEVADGLVRARKHQRGPTQHCAQKDLQTAVAADVVEGAPHPGSARRRAAGDRAREARQAVHHQLRAAVVPEVSRTHCVSSVPCRGAASGKSVALHPMISVPAIASGSAAASKTTASISPAAISPGRCATATPGGHRTSRRATPSSSIMARAATSWSLVRSSTDRPRSRSKPLPKLEDRTSSPSATLALAPKSEPPAASASPSLPPLLCSTNAGRAGSLVEGDEIAESGRKFRVLREGEGVESQVVLEPRDDDG